MGNLIESHFCFDLISVKKGFFMQNLLNELEELKRRFNYEIDKFIIQFKELSRQIHNTAKTLETTCNKEEIEKFVTINRLCEIYPSFKIGGIRSLIFHNKWKFETECIIRQGRKLLIDTQKFEEWLKKPKIGNGGTVYDRKQ
jgi:hypothetical protein